MTTTKPPISQTHLSEGEVAAMLGINQRTLQYGDCTLGIAVCPNRQTGPL